MGTNELKDKTVKTMGEDCGNQSLLAALNKFVLAVNAMDEAVMIPSRLRDMDISGSALPEINVENNNRAVLPTVLPGTDLHSIYTMLKTVKGEIISGSPKSGEDSDGSSTSGESDSDTDSTAIKTAAAFRFHLSGLFSLLHQLTESAKYLSKRYETELGQSSNSRSSSLGSFAL